MAGLTKKKNKAYKDEPTRNRHFFALASVFGSHRSTLRLYEERGVADADSFGLVAFTASALSRAGRAEEAWRVVENGVRLWWPVDLAQMAPVELLTDEGLRPLMTPERCEQVLRTPRGEEGLPKKPSAKKS